MFSPAWWPRPHVRSTCGPLVWDSEPCAAILLALLNATLYRQPLHVSGPSPWVARSWLMSACWVELTTSEGRAGTGADAGAAAAGAAGGTGGTGLGLGGGWAELWGWGGPSSATARGTAVAALFAAVSVCAGAP